MELPELLFPELLLLELLFPEELFPKFVEPELLLPVFVFPVLLELEDDESSCCCESSSVVVSSSDSVSRYISLSVSEDVSVCVSDEDSCSVPLSCSLEMEEGGFSGFVLHADNEVHSRVISKNRLSIMFRFLNFLSTFPYLPCYFIV